MSFNSVEMQVILHKTHDVGKIQQTQQQQVRNEAEYSVAQNKQEYENRETSVNTLGYTENNDVNVDQHGHKNKQSFKQKKNKKSENQEEDTEISGNIQPHLGKNLDLHI